MARIQKDGLDYFPLDVTFFSDKDTRIIRSKFGSDGVLVYLYLKCEAFRQGYYFIADDDFILLMSDELNIRENLTKQIIHFLLARSLFDNTLFQSDKVITSANIQKQYQASKKTIGAKRDIFVNRSFWLLNFSETESFIKLYPTENKSEINPDLSEKNEDKSENNSQSIVKYSKEKESIVKESKPLDFSLYNKVIYLYNYICEDMVECQLSGGRIAAIQNLTEQKFNGQNITLSDIAKSFVLANRSDFLTGKAKPDFKADLDWILRYENFIKILECKYSRMPDNSYNIDDFDRFAINYILPERQRLPRFCNGCQTQNPYYCIIDCQNQGWADRK